MTDFTLRVGVFRYVMSCSVLSLLSQSSETLVTGTILHNVTLKKTALFVVMALETSGQLARSWYY